MAEDQGQGSGTDQNADDQNVDDQDQNADDQNQDGTDSDDDGSADDGKSTVSRTDYDALFKRMQAADKAKAAAENKLREKERAELSDMDRMKAELDEAKQNATSAADKLKAMIIENAFHRENKFSWHDVSDAIAALDLSGVEVTEDGKVTGMAQAIKDVAKKKPHYVKSREDQDDQGEGDDPPAANSATNGRRKGGKGETPDVKKLVARFPALGK